MSKKDLFLSFAAAFVVGIFLFPTLLNTSLYSKLPFAPLLLLVILPLVATVGMFIAFFLGKKLAILWQLAKFAEVGVLNTAIDFGILNFFILLTGVTSGLGIILMNATSFTTALVNSFFWNKEWVFGESKKSNFLTFFIVTLIGLLLNTGTVFALTTYVHPVLVKSPTLWANLAKVLATGLSMVWNFAGYKVVVFKK